MFGRSNLIDDCLEDKKNDYRNCAGLVVIQAQFETEFRNWLLSENTA